jgi:hypothetical protein
MKILAEWECHINYERKAKKTLIKSYAETFKPQIEGSKNFQSKISVATAFAYFCGFSFCVWCSLTRERG